MLLRVQIVITAIQWVHHSEPASLIHFTIDRRSGLSPCKHPVWHRCRFALVSMEQRLSVCMTLCAHFQMCLLRLPCHLWMRQCHVTVSGRGRWYKLRAVSALPLHPHCSLPLLIVGRLDIWKCESSLVFTQPALAALAWRVIALQCCWEFPWWLSLPGT